MNIKVSCNDFFIKIVSLTFKPYPFMTNRSQLKFAMFSHDVQWAFLGVLAFPITVFFIWFYYIKKYRFYRKTDKVLLKGYKNEPVKKSDKRYNVGYRVIGYTKVSFYEWQEANEKDLLLNKKKANIFLGCLIAHIVIIVLILLSKL